MRKVRLSAFVRPNEIDNLPHAFELGLLSWHQNQFSVKAIVRILEEFMQVAKQYAFSEIKLAAHHLRKYLVEVRNYTSLLKLEERLIETFPGEPELLLNLARTNVEAGHYDAAKTLLKQANFLDASLAQECQSINAMIQEKNPKAAAKMATTQKDTFGIKSCVVVEPDPSVSNFVVTMLKDLGIANTQHFPDGESAWAWLEKNPEPDLILQEWRLPKLGGIAFIQRIRSHGFKKALIVVISSLVKRDDLPS